MKTIEKRQKLPISVEEAWGFFSNPSNLKKITPDHMGFEILNGPLPDAIYPGMIIIYAVRPLFNIPMKWVTEITQVEAPRYFIDNQKSGPYAFWHHQHFIEETETGVEIIDIVNFKVPFGVVGKLLEKWIVSRKVEEIFAYRSAVMKNIFGAGSPMPK